MKTFSKQEIQEFVAKNDTVGFKQAILDSKGFILYLANKMEIPLNPVFLIDTISQYSIRFISEHMINHKYTPAQTEVVISYLREDPFESRVGANYSLETFLNQLRTDSKDIPLYPEKFFCITLDDFLKNPKEFRTFLSRGLDGDSVFSKFYQFFVSEGLIENLFSKLTKEDFLKIDKDILLDMPSLFYLSKHLMGDREIKDLFLDVVDSFLNLPEIVSLGYAKDLDLFQSYVFTEEDRDLFISLLKPESAQSYGEMKDFHGFESLFSKKDYALNHNLASITYLTEDEIIENVDAIREKFTDFYSKSRQYFNNQLNLFKISEKSFDVIFTRDFIRAFIINNGEYTFFDEKNSNRLAMSIAKHKDLRKSFNDIVISLCSEEPEILKIVGYTNCLQHVCRSLNNTDPQLRRESNQIMHKLLGCFDESLDSDVLFKNYSKTNFQFLPPNVLDEMISKRMTNKHSVNYLYALSKMFQDSKGYSTYTIMENNKDYKPPLVEREINRIIPLLNNKDILSLQKILMHKIIPKTVNLLKSNPRGNFENNFLNFNPEAIKKMDFDFFSTCFKTFGEFRHMVLKENLDYIIIDNDRSVIKPYHINKKPHLDLVDRMLDNFIPRGFSILPSIKSLAGNNDLSIADFSKSFVSRNKDFFLNNYKSKIINHPYRESLIKINRKDIENESFNQLCHLKEDFLAKRAELSNPDAVNSNPSLVAEIASLSPILKEHMNNIGFKLFSDKVKNSSLLESIDLLEISSVFSVFESKKLAHLILNKIKSFDFTSVTTALKDKRVENFILDNLLFFSYENLKPEHEKFYFNPGFSNQENINIVESLLRMIKNRSDLSDNAKPPLSKILYLISPEKRYLISNDLAIKYEPLSVFSSFFYVPENNLSNHIHVKTPFRNDQILKAIDNLNQQGLKIFSAADSRESEHNRLLSHTYAYSANDGKNPKLQEYLSLLKSLENDPLNYFSCIDFRITRNFINEDAHGNKKIAHSHFINEHINHDVVMEALKEIISIHKNFSDKNFLDKNGSIIYQETKSHGMNLMALRQAVAFHISILEYDSSRNFHPEPTKSAFSVDKSRDIMNLFVHEAPYLLLNTPSIGMMGEVSKELSENFANYYHENMINDFFITSSKLRCVTSGFGLSPESDGASEKIADVLIKQLVAHLTEEKDLTCLYKLDFIVQEHQFNTGRPYSKTCHYFTNELSGFLDTPPYRSLLKQSLAKVNMLNLSERLLKTSVETVAVKPRVSKI